MDLVGEFVARYVKEYDYYSHAARLVAEILEENLRTAGVRCMVTSRAKSVSRLADKCRKRALDKPYSSIEDIYNDIADLAGVRVALYFPAEEEQVDAEISRSFHRLEPAKRFPREEKQATDEGEPRYVKRFSGYKATHHRVQLKESELGEPDRRYAGARVEVQVASVLMHGWAEVEHDLVYKPLEGALSTEELAILDQLNGLVLAGEIALERLQAAGESRVAQEGRQFVNHYELTVHLLDRAKTVLADKEVHDWGLGRVDLLFDLLVRLGKATPKALKPYLEDLHGNVEMRPLAEQVVDALLAEDAARYDVFRSVRAESYGRGPHGASESSSLDQQIGRFLRLWAELEVLVRRLDDGAGQPVGLVLRRLADRWPDNARIFKEADNLRRLRNQLVHGIEPPDLAIVSDASDLLERIIAELRRLYPDA
ncbi:RelA/SpoT domain-containing protein [Amycolatopsis sp. CA-128772]|uniref:RelA/SpoT domain-containing protein n=1 Tax=Amycolatopsis sp. CA-128772 TaxID=2073159 RepID=UPI001304DE96|nr:RelA/SpoT domain-containing protein [Amycolatopsis sp. CA-128772]